MIWEHVAKGKCTSQGRVRLEKQFPCCLLYKLKSAKALSAGWPLTLFFLCVLFSLLVRESPLLQIGSMILMVAIQALSAGWPLTLFFLCVLFSLLARESPLLQIGSMILMVAIQALSAGWSLTLFFFVCYFHFWFVKVLFCKLVP
jgi:hypothetical protein